MNGSGGGSGLLDVGEEFRDGDWWTEGKKSGRGGKGWIREWWMGSEGWRDGSCRAREMGGMY